MSLQPSRIVTIAAAIAGLAFLGLVSAKFFAVRHVSAARGIAAGEATRPPDAIILPARSEKREIEAQPAVIAAETSKTALASKIPESKSSGRGRSGQKPQRGFEADIALLQDNDAFPGVQSGALLDLARFHRGDDRVTQAILDYIQSPINWSKAAADKSWLPSAVLVKARGLDYLGMVRTPLAKKALLAAMTPEGAQALGQNWLPGLENGGYTQAGAIGRLRGYASEGLAYYSDDPKIHDLLRAAYLAEEQRLVDAGQDDSDYFAGLVDMMARLDIFADMGMDAHDALYDGNMEYFHNLYANYVVKNNYPILAQRMAGLLAQK